MINKVLNYLKHYYPVDIDSNIFEIVNDGIIGDFNYTALVGQYININGSILNDGVYKITEISSNKITVDSSTLIPEDSSVFINIIYLAIPKSLLDLIVEIKTYIDGQSTSANIKSESQGNVSITYVNGSDWQSAFKTQLSSYRNIYDDRNGSINRKYDLNVKY